MKKVLFILIAFLIFPFTSKAEPVTLNLFYGQECPYCHHEIAYLTKLQNQMGDNLKINKFLFQVSIGWIPLFRFQNYEDCCNLAQQDKIYVVPYSDYRDEEVANIIQDFRALNCTVGDFEGF